MKQFHLFLALIGLIFVTKTSAQPDPSLKKPGMELKPTYVHAHQDGKVIPAELVLEIQRTGQKSHAPIWALEQATIYRLQTVASTFEEKTGNRLDLEQYLGPDSTWHQKLNNPDNGFLVSNRNNPGRKIWTYGWLPAEFTAPDGTVFQQGWYYFDRTLYRVGEKGYLENEGTIDLDCSKLFPDVPEMQGVFIAWYADGCANPSLPDNIPFKEPIAEQRRARSPNVIDPFTGSNWVVSVQVSSGYQQQQFQPAPQYFDYCGGVGMGYGFNYCPQYVPMFNNNCWNCGSYANPQNVTNIYEGDQIINEGDNIINEGDIVIINNPPDEEPPVDEPGGPAPGNTGGNGNPNPGNTGDGNGGGPAPGNTGMALQGSGAVNTDAKSSVSGTTSSFDQIDERVSAEAEYWASAQDQLLAERESRITTLNRPNNTNTSQGGNVYRPDSQNSRPNTYQQNGNVARNPNSSSGRVPTMEQAQTSPVRGNGDVNRPNGQTSSRPNGNASRVPTVEEAQVSRPNTYQQNGNVVRNPNSSSGRVPTMEQAQVSPSRTNNGVTTNQGGNVVRPTGGNGTVANTQPTQNYSPATSRGGGGVSRGGGGGSRGGGGGRR
jgi:hypothetical protein